MGDLVNILEKQPHLSGEALCLNCKHKWVAVAPVGVPSLECPSCNTFKGVWDGIVIPNDSIWECKCGCQHLFCCVEYMICCHCGTKQEFK